MFLKIALNQARHKWPIALLIVLAMTCLVTLYVYASNTTRFANRSMELVMKNMGHNLLILPKKADPWSIYLGSDSQVVFPAEITQRMSEALSLSSRYYVSVLQARRKVGDQDVLLTGIAPVARGDETREKDNMVLPLGVSEARLGYECARMLGKKAGQSLAILGQTFRIVEVLPPKATLDDCRVYVQLGRCQEMLGKPRQIHFILAFLCLHGGSLDRAAGLQEQKLAQLFPDFRQISRADIAQGRYLARLTTQRSLYYLLAIVATATVVIVAVTGLQEVSDRRHETGIMIAMGVSHSYLVCLYIAKTLVLALTASVLGFLLGSALAVRFTAPFLVVHTEPVTTIWQHLPVAIGLTCAVAVAAELIPIIRLVRLDPNAILAEQ
ncbi:MAG: hypothetical protein A2W31_16410 [Planctomycetes bacterium RBG_16_64_10]|nr:MAG: hypothetical protein A2W31_16410 [Planctomycetes bacterium RBG_16_64_10]